MYNDYTYDGLNRLDGVDYLVNDYSSTDDGTDDFVMDDLGNRTGDQTLRDVTVGYTVNNDTNRYTAIGTGSPAHDNAGNLTTDHRGYDYYYDYENRIMLIEDAESTTIASFGYDALGRRIRKTDYTAPGDPCDQQTLYYYNAAWQVLTEHDGTGYFRRLFVYGNYIDETLLMDDGTSDHYYAHNHLFSTVAFLDDTGSIAERYEYDAYGKVTMFDPDFTTWSGTAAGNPYTFTGRRLDSLDGGDLCIMYYRNRYYDPETGRFLSSDPLQYVDSINLFQYVINNPMSYLDPSGLLSLFPGFNLGQEFGDWTVVDIGITEVTMGVESIRVEQSVSLETDWKNLGSQRSKRKVGENVYRNPNDCKCYAVYYYRNISYEIATKLRDNKTAVIEAIINHPGYGAQDLLGDISLLLSTYGAIPGTPYGPVVGIIGTGGAWVERIIPDAKAKLKYRSGSYGSIDQYIRNQNLRIGDRYHEDPSPPVLLECPEGLAAGESLTLWMEAESETRRNMSSELGASVMRLASYGDQMLNPIHSQVENAVGNLIW